MDEQAAIDGLMAEIMGEAAPMEAEAPQATPAPAEEPKSDLPDIKAMLAEQSKMIADLKAKADKKEEKEVVQEQLTAEQMQEQEMVRQAQEKLGISQLLQKQQQMEAEKLRAEQFKAEEAKFKQTHPEVNLDELAQWAQGNGYEQVLGMGAQGWKLIAGAMLAQAKPSHKPDPVTPSSSQGAEPNAFDRIKKGEKVNDIDIGLDILKYSGL